MDQVGQRFVVESLNELKQLLKNPLVEVELNPVPLSTKAVQIVESELQKAPQQTEEPFQAYRRAISQNLSRPEWSPLVVYCKPDSELATAARKQMPAAYWGCTVGSTLSAVYRLGNKYILWHEILHLFNANDCYPPDDPNRGPTCELPNCIMQYAPTKKTVGEWPFLCQKNIKRIKDRSEKQNCD